MASSSARNSYAENTQQVMNSNKKSKNGFISPTAIATYGGVFAIVISLVSIGYRAPQESSNAANVAEVSAVSSAVNIESPSVDQTMATDIAASMAEKASLPVAPNVANMSISLAARSELTQDDDMHIAKPQIVQASADSREIIEHSAKAGETVQDIARKYGVSARTIKWANNMSSDAVEEGRKVVVPPVDGILYEVKDGDTIQDLAETYKSDEDRIVAFNDLELSGLNVGSQIMLPGGVMPGNTQTSGGIVGQIASVHSTAGFAPRVNTSAGNAYAFGNCTHYAYARRAQLGRPIGSFWGNANTWAMNAAASGFAVNRTPAPGAVFQESGGFYGHVGVVESVNPDGSIVVSEMNYFGAGGGGFNVVSTRTISAGQVPAYNYIH